MSQNKVKKFALGAIFVVLAGLMASCIKPDPFANLNCPSVQVLGDARVLTKFKPGLGRDITDIEYEGRIAKVDFTCKENSAKGYVEINLTVRTEFILGMAAPVRNPEFPFFVAVSEGERRVLNKTDHVVKARFEGTSRVAREATNVRRIRVPLGGDVPVEYYNVIAGFQLSPAQVAYNRTKNNN